MGKVSQFFKNRYLVSQRDHVADDYQHSDFGRTYGWWVLLGGKRVASLEYRSFLEEPVHLYQVHVLDPAFSKIDQDPEKWASHDVVIESRYAEDYLKKGLEMAPVGKGMIVVQNLYVPEPYFKRQHDKVELFHDELLGNAKQSRSKKGSEELKEEDTTEADSAPAPAPAPDKKTLAGAAAPAGQESSNAPAEEVAEEGSGDQDKEQKSLETQERVENKHQDREQRRLEREKIKLEKREQKRLEKEKAEQLKQEQLELERLEKERVAQAKLEQEKAEAERLENERIESERLEKMRLDQERQQQVLLEQERLNKQRLEQQAEERRLAAAEQQVVEPPAVQQPIPQPPKFSSAEESWQSKLGGTPRQSHASQPSRGEGDAG